jgi:hypothetical protein
MHHNESFEILILIDILNLFRILFSYKELWFIIIKNIGYWNLILLE